MVVALRAAGRQPEPGDAGGAHPVDHRQIAKLERVDSPLLVDHRVAVEAGGDDVVGRVAGEKIAGDLAAREGVEGHVVVEGPDHPIAIGPDPPFAVFLIAVGVGIAGQVEPPPRPALAVTRAGKQSIDEFFVGVGRLIGDKGVELGWRRRQPRQIEVDAAAERGPIGFASRPQPFAGEPVADEEVDRIDRRRGSGRVCHLRHRRARRLLKRPVLGVRRPGGDPCLEDPLLLGREHRLRVGRGHDDVGVGAVDPGHDFTVVGVPRDDRPVPRIGLGEGVITAVEAQAPGARAVVGAVALEAAVGKDRPNLAAEVGPLTAGKPRGGNDGKQGNGRNEEAAGGDHASIVSHRPPVANSSAAGPSFRGEDRWQVAARTGGKAGPSPRGGFLDACICFSEN